MKTNNRCIYSHNIIDNDINDNNNDENNENNENNDNFNIKNILKNGENKDVILNKQNEELIKFNNINQFFGL